MYLKQVMLAVLLYCTLSSLALAAVDKLHIDPSTKQYVSATDGRVHMLHGLAIEDSSPPWELATYTDEQIELMKSVSTVQTSLYL